MLKGEKNNRAKVQYYCQNCKQDVHLYGSSKKFGKFRTCNTCGYNVYRKVL